MSYANRINTITTINDMDNSNHWYRYYCD